MGYLLVATNKVAVEDEWWTGFMLRPGEKYTESSSFNVNLCIFMWTTNILMIMAKDWSLTTNHIRYLIIYAVAPDREHVKPKCLSE